MVVISMFAPSRMRARALATSGSGASSLATAGVSESVMRRIPRPRNSGLLRLQEPADGACEQPARDETRDHGRDAVHAPVDEHGPVADGAYRLIGDLLGAHPDEARQRTRVDVRALLELRAG